jgi:hypothetical protein
MISVCQIPIIKMGSIIMHQMAKSRKTIISSFFSTTFSQISKLSFECLLGNNLELEAKLLASPLFWFFKQILFGIASQLANPILMLYPSFFSTNHTCMHVRASPSTVAVLHLGLHTAWSNWNDFLFIYYLGIYITRFWIFGNWPH